MPDPVPRGFWARISAALCRPEGLALGWIAGLLVLRLISVFTHAVDSDEPQNLHVIYQWLKGDLPYLEQFDNHTPLFHLLFLPFAWLAGETPNVVPFARLALLPLSFGVLGLIYLLARRLYDRRVALWGLVFTLALADWSLKSIEFRPDVLWVVLWFAALCVLVRPSGRPGPAAFVLAGLLLGAAVMSSVKTIFLLPALALGWAGAWMLSREFRAEYPWPRIATCAVGGAIGFAVVPGLMAAFFAAHGALDEMAWCVYAINRDPFLGERSWIVLPGLFVALCGAWYLLRPASLRTGYRVAVFLSAALYALAVVSFGPYESLAKQSFLPAYPLLLFAACHGFLSFRAWSSRTILAVLGASAAALTVVMMIGSPPWKDGNAAQRKLLTAVIEGTRPADFIMDMKGETVFRNRPVYMVYVGNTERKMRSGQVPLPDPALLRTKAVAFTIDRTGGFPDGMQNFIKANYVGTTAGRLRVAGKVLKPSFENGRWIARENIEIAGKYLVVDAGRITGEVLVSEAGPRSFAFEDRDRRVLFWKAAWDHGLRPVER